MSELGAILLYIIGIIIVLLPLIIVWKFFVKAGRPGWASLIPIYNTYILVKIAGRPGWWTILYLIPVIDIVIAIIVAIDIAKAFGRSTAFGVFGLFLFSIIGYAILAFGSDTYKGLEIANPAGQPLFS